MSKFVGLVTSIIIIFTNIGCWDLKGITSRAFVTSIGLDASDKGYKVTFVVPKPSKIRSREIQVDTFSETVEAESISKAVSILQTGMSRDVNLSHLRVLIIGEKIAREKNFNDLMSFFEKHPDIAMRFRLMFAEGEEAQDVLNNMPQLDRSITSEIVGLAMAGENLGMARSRRFQVFLGDLRAADGTALGTRIISTKEKNTENIVSLGGAIFSHWHLVGWLSAHEMQKANWLLNRNPNSVVVCKLGRGQFSYAVETKKVKITPRIKDERPRFEVHIKTVGGIIEQEGSSLDLSEPRNLNRLRGVLVRTIRDQAITAVYKSQKESGVDYLGFGRVLQQGNPELYKKTDWQKIYRDVPVEIKVDVRIPRFGVTTR